MKNILFALISLSMLFAACGKDSDYADIDEELIQDYIAENNLTTQVTDDGIHYIIESEGTGTQAEFNSTVTVHYEGFLLNGSKFDSSYDRGMPSTFSLNAVIAGWQLGIPLFKEGGRGTLIIPSRFAYANSSPSSAIPRNSVLLFNIELIDVQ